jgi:hypothetical protein
MSKCIIKNEKINGKDKEKFSALIPKYVVQFPNEVPN